jgi:uncharacterized protein YukJ
MQRARHKKEFQYHLHADLAVAGSTKPWDVAVNVGTNDSDDLLRYRLVLDYHHPLTGSLAELAMGLKELTGTKAFPALDFLRSDLLAETGKWRDSDVMDGSEDAEPYASLKRLLDQAYANSWNVYFYGRLYTTGGDGIHDIHMNQGSTGGFVNEGDDHNDHNDVWQDGAVIVEMADGEWGGYFTAFTQQSVPTNDRGNVRDGAHEIDDTDPGSLQSEAE